jgi:hypothetical protein
MTFKHFKLWFHSQWITKQNKTASAFGLNKSCYEQIYSYHNLYLTITVYISSNQRCVNNACEKCMLNRRKYSSIQNVQRLKDLIWTKLFCDVLSFPNSCCISSEMSKTYLLNTPVLQELIINLSLHSRSTKIIIPTYIE